MLKPVTVTPGILILVLFSLSIEAQQYELDGVIEEHRFDARGLFYAGKFDFAVFINGCGWLIHAEPAGQAGPVTKTEVGSTNGAELFELIITPPAVVTQSVAEATGPSPAGAASNARLIRVDESSHVYIRSNTVPIALWTKPLISHLWLMFASHCYFANLATNRLPPVFDRSRSSALYLGLTLDADWKLLGGAGTLPLEVIYYSDGRIYHANTNGELAVYIQYPPPYKNGFTNAIYTVTGLTNVGNLLLPQGFTFEEFQPGGNRSRYDLRVCRRITAVVTDARPACSRASLLPRPQGRTVISDYRLARARPARAVFTYFRPPGRGWISVAESWKTYQRQERAKKPAPLVLKLVIVVVLAPGIAYAARLIRKRMLRPQSGRAHSA